VSQQAKWELPIRGALKADLAEERVEDLILERLTPLIWKGEALIHQNPTGTGLLATLSHGLIFSSISPLPFKMKSINPF